MKEERNVLVLGGNGFIGSHLVDRLRSEGRSVRVFDKYPERYREPLAGIEYHLGDFGNRGLLREALNGIDVVYHLISTSVPKTSNDDPAYDIQSNVIETVFLLEQCVTSLVKKVVFVSSGGTIYGSPLELPVSEDHPTHPDCSYGITKLMIEKYLRLFHQLHGLDYTIVRPSNPYGIRQNPHGIQGAIAVFLGKALTQQPIELWGDGSICRDFLYIDDLIEGIILASRTTAPRIFNIGSGVSISLNELIAIIRTVTGLSVPVRYRVGRPFDVPRLCLDISRARTELGWSPRVDLETGIGWTVDFIRSVAGKATGPEVIEWSE